MNWEVAAAVLFTIELVVGVLFGMWVVRKADDHVESHDDSYRRLGEQLSKFRDLAGDVATHVGQHSAQVDTIDRKLAGLPGIDADGQQDALAALIAELLAANEQLHGELSVAQTTIEEQTRQVESHMVEARTDALTGVANRRAFDDEVQQQFDRWRKGNPRFSVLLADIDHFKRVNDDHGHLLGDQALQLVGQAMQRATRDRDGVFRYGGEEFAVLMPAATLSDAKLSAERIRKATQAIVLKDGEATVPLTVSIGVADVRTGDDVEAIVSRSDSALYTAKDSGRNCSYYHDGSECLPVVTSAEELQPASNDLSATEPAEGERADGASAVATSSTQASKSNATTMLAAAEEAKARCDSVTGLPDVGDLAAELSRRLAERRRFKTLMPIMFIEVANWTSLCESVGDEVTTAVLRALSRFLKSTMRQTDLIVKGPGGKFAVTLPQASVECAMAVAERVRSSVAAVSFRSDKLEFGVDVAVAVVNPAPADDEAAVLEKGDEALEEAKRLGSHCIYFHDGQRCVSCADYTTSAAAAG